MEEQAFRTMRIEQRIVDEQSWRAVELAELHINAGVFVFLLIPLQHGRQFAAIGADPPIRRTLATIDAEAPPLCIVADVAGLNDHEILPVMRMRAMAVGRHLASHSAMVERKRAEMLRQQNDRISLALVRAEMRVRASLGAARSQATNNNYRVSARIDYSGSPCRRAAGYPSHDALFRSPPNEAGKRRATARFYPAFAG